MPLKYQMKIMRLALSSLKNTWFSSERAMENTQTLA
jgi:hypothetical protein